jgi:hypothetical protein
LPSVISLNALVNSPEVFDVWKNKRSERYLKPSIKLQAEADGSITVGAGVEYRVQVSSWKLDSADVRLW